MEKISLLIGRKRVHSHVIPECKVVTRVQIKNSARSLSKFRLSSLSVMYYHVHHQQVLT